MNASKQSGEELRIWKICRLINLNKQESFLLLLYLACVFNRKYERIFGYIQDNVSAKLLTLGHGISLLSLEDGRQGKVSQESNLWLCLFAELRDDMLQESKISYQLEPYQFVYDYICGAPLFTASGNKS